MSAVSKLRTFATPLTIGAFFLSSVTGIALFFHVNTQGSKALHEYMGWLLISGVVLHVATNWGPFSKYFRQKLALAVMIPLVLLTVLSFAGGGGAQQKGPSPQRRASEALLSSSVELAGRVARREPEDTLATLRAAGLKVESGEQTVREVASSNGKPEGEVLGLLFP